MGARMLFKRVVVANDDIFIRNVLLRTDACGAFPWMDIVLGYQT